MATARRRHANLPANRKAAFSPAAKIAFVVIGTAGLAALAIAIFGPQRFQREIVKPVRSAVGDQAGQLSADSRPLGSRLERCSRVPGARWAGTGWSGIFSRGLVISGRHNFPVPANGLTAFGLPYYS